MARYCVICGHELITEDNQMLSDIIGEELPIEHDVMVTYAHCPHCGCNYEMQDPSNDELVNDNTFVGSMNIFKNNEETDA